MRGARIAAALAVGSAALFPRVADAQQAATLTDRREVHLGLEVRIVVASRDPETGDRAVRAAFDRIEALEEILSDWRPASEVSLLAGRPPTEVIAISSELRDVLHHALEIARATEGAFDPTVGPLTRLWREAQRTGQPVADSARARARAAVDHQAVRLDLAAGTVVLTKPGMRLDLGGIAKGWIAERAMDVLERVGIRDAMIEAGGEIVTRGAPPGEPGWRIVVGTSRGDTTLVVQDAAVSTSSARAQVAPSVATPEEGHVFRPSTGRGETETVQLTVLGTDATITDALATALPLLPRARWSALAERYDVRIIEP